MASIRDLPQAKSLTQAQLNALLATARRLGVNPEELLTIIAYETGGTLSPDVVGGEGNAYSGLIQGGSAAKKDFPLLASSDFEDQLMGAEQYLKAKGVEPGEGILNMYSAINAGYDKPNRYDRKDMSGKTVTQHVEDMSTGPYNQQAKSILAQYRPTEANREPAPEPTFAAREPPDYADQPQPAASITDVIKGWKEMNNQPQEKWEQTTLGGWALQQAGYKGGSLGDAMRSSGLTGQAKEQDQLLQKADKEPYNFGTAESRLRAKPQKRQMTLANLMFGVPEKETTLLGMLLGRG